ncbi:MAG TPA: fibronectin type III domain-containing protein [Solirubrobacteraceae bacterium]|jgi:hypothetical protein|nr:fibronectin type III domain-containing protein [Solirubrobacteraceae bacterium]
MSARRSIRVGLSALGATAASLMLFSAPALAAPQAPVTVSPAGSVTATSATLKGVLNPSAVAKAGWYFAYSPEQYGPACIDAFAAGGEPESAEEFQARPEETQLTGLEPSRKYEFCLVATNALGETTPGNEVPFTTNPSAPTIDSQASSGLTPFDAMLEGQVNPNNQETTYHLEYATTEAALGTASAITRAYGIVGPGVYGDQSVGPVDLGGGLTPNTTYYYRVVAKNPTGEVKGTAKHPVETFTTLLAEKPTVTGEKLVGATPSTDTIEAQLNPAYQGVSCEVQYVTKGTYEKTGFTENVEVSGCSPLPPASEFGQGGSPVPVTATLGGLQEDGAYEYRVVASNGTGTTEGVPQLLTRTPPQIAGATNVSAVTQHTVSVRPSTLTPEVEAPLEASYYILYGTGKSDELASAHVKAGSGLTPNSVGAVELYGLQAGTIYHYEVVAYNGNATATGPEETFTTASAAPLTTPPTVGSETAQFVNETGAVIEGEVDPEGLETSYMVQYGTSTAYGSSTPGLAALPPFTSSQGTITSLVGLSPSTVYHYRIVATSQAGTAYGPDETLVTGGAPQTGTFTSFTIPTVPLLGQTAVAFPAEEPAGKSAPKTLTNKQKLAQALKACAKKPGKQRSKCEKQARKRYSPAKKKH